MWKWWKRTYAVMISSVRQVLNYLHIICTCNERKRYCCVSVGMSECVRWSGKHLALIIDFPRIKLVTFGCDVHTLPGRDSHCATRTTDVPYSGASFERTAYTCIIDAGKYGQRVSRAIAKPESAQAHNMSTSD